MADRINLRLLRLLAVGVIVVAVLFGLIAIVRRTDSAPTDESGHLVRPQGNASLRQARAYRGHPLYFAGETAAGHRLEAVMRIDRRSPAPHTEFSFIYGRCRATGDHGCAPALTIL